MNTKLTVVTEKNEEWAKIRNLSPGDAAEIVGYEDCDPRYRSKLLSMGLTKRTRLTLIKVAPLGDPVEIELRGFLLSLRKDEADVIRLKLEKMNSGKVSPRKEKSPMGLLSRIVNLFMKGAA